VIPGAIQNIAVSAVRGNAILADLVSFHGEVKIDSGRHYYGIFESALSGIYRSIELIDTRGAVHQGVWGGDGVLESLDAPAVSAVVRACVLVVLEGR
jgi:hypothetical protein